MDKAKEIALDHAKLLAETVSFTKVKLDYDDGMAEYEIEFVVDGMEYEYTIDAASGTITEYEVKKGKLNKGDKASSLVMTLGKRSETTEKVK